MGLHFPHTDRIVTTSAKHAADLVIWVAVLVFCILVVLFVADVISQVLVSVLMPLLPTCSMIDNSSNPAVPTLLHADCMQHYRVMWDNWITAITIVSTMIAIGIVYLMWVMSKDFARTLANVR